MRLCQLKVDSADFEAAGAELPLVDLPDLEEQVRRRLVIPEPLVDMAHGNVDEAVGVVLLAHDLLVHLQRFLEERERILEVACLHVAPKGRSLNEMGITYLPSRVRI